MKALSTPFLMLNLVGIVQHPVGTLYFDTPKLIEELFTIIDNQADLTVNFEDIWLPVTLFSRQLTVGDVYRLGDHLFTAAYQYRDGRHSQETFENLCKELHGEIVFSEQETKAFNSWSAEQLSMARDQPAKNPELRLRTRE